MKIGFVVHFYDFRNDVRKIIQLINAKHEVVLFVRKQDQEIIQQYCTDLEIRVIDEQKTTFLNKILDTVFRFFGKLPKSRQNYFLMECFKISASAPKKAQKRASLLLKLAMKFPRFVEYDTYLSKIDYKQKTYVEDINQFVCFTDISDSYFFARLVHEKKNIKVYVYSWDHPCKHVKYSHHVKYLVWHEGIKQDLIDLQGIEPAQIQILGATQFGYINAFFSQKPRQNPYSFSYIYFGCAVGIPILTLKEIEVIKKISQWLTDAQSTLKLVVRPYPVLTNWSFYEELKNLPNVILDDQFRSSNLSIEDEQIYEKYNKIVHAEAFIHLGTTMGLETCFTNTPSVILDLPEFITNDNISLYNFVHQFQNDKYLIDDFTMNIVRSSDHFKSLLVKLKTDKKALLLYNEKVRQNIPLKSFEQLSEDLVALFQSDNTSLAAKPIIHSENL